MFIYINHCKQWGKSIEKISKSFKSKFKNNHSFWTKGFFKKEHTYYKTIYKHLVDKGKQNMKKYNVLIMGACKNLISVLPKNLKDWSVLGQQFNDYCIFMYENDSTDGTTEFLQKWTKENKKHIALMERHVKFPPGSRLIKMQYIRQKCLDYYVNSIKPNFKADYILLFDTDLVIGVHPYAIPCAFSLNSDEFDIQWANGYSYERMHSPYSNWFKLVGMSKVNYDGLAMELPNNGRVCNGFWKQEGWCKNNKAKYQECKKYDFVPDLIPMNSAFGGLGVYKEEAYVKGIYYSKNNIVDDCEHILFHKSIRDQGYIKTFINPLLLVVR